MTKRILEITLSNPLVSQRRKQRFPKGQELLKSKMICDKIGNRPQRHMLSSARSTVECLEGIKAA